MRVNRVWAGSPPNTPCCPPRHTPAAAGNWSRAKSAAAPRRSAGWSAGRCARASTSPRSAKTPSPSTATCCKPTAAPAPPPSPAAYVALVDAVTWLRAAGRLADPQPISCAIAAVSVGVVDGRVRLDLPYEEDSRAEVDMNVVATDTGTFVEIQGTGEGATFPRSTMDKLLDSAVGGCEQLFEVQKIALAEPYPGVLPEPAVAPAKRKFGA